MSGIGIIPYASYIVVAVPNNIFPEDIILNAQTKSNLVIQHIQQGKPVIIAAKGNQTSDFTSLGDKVLISHRGNLQDLKIEGKEEFFIIRESDILCKLDD
jgi:hypothetical protein